MKGCNTISSWSSADVRALKMLGRCCSVERDLLKLATGISENRLNTLKNLKLVKIVDDGEHLCVRTTGKGRELIAEKTGILPYHSSGIEHDIALGRVYASLSVYEQDT